MRQFENALERAVVDFHHEKAGFGGAASVRPVATDAEPIAFDGDLEIFAAHAGEFYFDDQAAVGGVNIGIGYPVTVGG